MNNLKEVIAPLPYVAFNDFKGKFLKGDKRYNQKKTKNKRNVILKINSNIKL